MPTGAATTSEEVLLYTDWPTRQKWQETMQAAGIPARLPEQIADWSLVRFAAVWSIPAHILAQCPNLEVIASLGAGVDHIMVPGLVPSQVTITRIVDPLMAQRMATFVLWAVINGHRKMDWFADAQRRQVWERGVETLELPDTQQVHVGVLGLGMMGKACAVQLAQAGYSVSAWTRTPKQHEGITCYHGKDQLDNFVEHCDMLVCTLPLTSETRDMINARLLALLPRGAGVVNVARGALIVDGDLLGALESGQVGYACLDVFRQEPLPHGSPFWTHPQVRVLPHISSVTDMQNAVEQIADNYRRYQAQLPLQHIVNKDAGY